MRSPALACFLLLGGCAASESETRSTTPAAGDGARLDSSAVEVGIERVRPILSSCVSPGHGFMGTTWTVHLTIRNDGHPIDVRVDSDGESPDPALVACLEGALTGATFQPFTGDPVSVTYPLSIH